MFFEFQGKGIMLIYWLEWREQKLKIYVFLEMVVLMELLNVWYFELNGNMLIDVCNY